jgi:hypothetical protein
MKTAYVGSRRRNILVSEKWTEKEKRLEEKADVHFISAPCSAENVDADHDDTRDKEKASNKKITSSWFMSFIFLALLI